MNRKKVEKLFRKLMIEGLELDLTDDNLSGTPARVAKMYCEELFIGLNPETQPKISVFPNNKEYSQIILSDKIYFSSMCSHHFLPFSGFAWVMYIPEHKLLGLSKFSRTVTWFAARPQIQEQLTHDILAFIVERSEPKGAMVVLRALHQCMHCRGVKQHSGAGMVTSAIYGDFEHQVVRAEGMALIRLSTL